MVNAYSTSASTATRQRDRACGTRRRCCREQQTTLRGHWRCRGTMLAMSSWCEPSVFDATQVTTASTFHLELGRARTSQIPKSHHGLQEPLGTREVEHAHGAAEADRQHGRVRKSIGRKYDISCKPSPEMIAAELPPTAFEQASYFNVVYGAGA